MRRFNAILTSVMMVLFIFHSISGALMIADIYPDIRNAVSVSAWILVGVLSLHALIGIKLTIDTIIACKRAGISYFRANIKFWAARISGFCILIFMAFHIVIFTGHTTGGAYRLNNFGMAELFTQIFLVLSIVFHVFINVKPSLIAFGIRRFKDYAIDILIVLSVLLFFVGVAFFIYYLRWR